MAEGIKVEVNKTELESCIKKLDELYGKCIEVEEVETMQDLGNASANFYIIKNSYNSIAKNLAILVESIKALMESAQDGYIEVDETYETMIGNDIRYNELQERLEASNGDED